MLLYEGLTHAPDALEEVRRRGRHEPGGGSSTGPDTSACISVSRRRVAAEREGQEHGLDAADGHVRRPDAGASPRPAGTQRHGPPPAAAPVHHQGLLGLAGPGGRAQGGAGLVVLLLVRPLLARSLARLHGLGRRSGGVVEVVGMLLLQPVVVVGKGWSVRSF